MYNLTSEIETNSLKTVPKCSNLLHTAINDVDNGLTYFLSKQCTLVYSSLFFIAFILLVLIITRVYTKKNTRKETRKMMKRVSSAFECTTVTESLKRLNRISQISDGYITIDEEHQKKPNFNVVSSEETRKFGNCATNYLELNQKEPDYLDPLPLIDEHHYYEIDEIQ